MSTSSHVIGIAAVSSYRSGDEASHRIGPSADLNMDPTDAAPAPLAMSQLPHIVPTRFQTGVTGGCAC